FLDANLTLAQHPSETQERMMPRLLAWINMPMNATSFWMLT
ncbi:hypothetical protein CPA58_29780, partial [Klebsiella pneumoniae]